MLGMAGTQSSKMQHLNAFKLIKCVGFRGGGTQHLCLEKLLCVALGYEREHQQPVVQ